MYNNETIIDWNAIFSSSIEFIVDVHPVAMAPISSICFQPTICKTNKLRFRDIFKYIIPLKAER